MGSFKKLDPHTANSQALLMIEDSPSLNDFTRQATGKKKQ